MSNFLELDIGYEIREEIVELAAAGWALLPKSPPGDDPREVVAAIDAYLVAGARSFASDVDVDEAAASLGCLWGQQLCLSLNWEWVRLVDADGDSEAVPEDDAVIGIAPHDRRFVILPMYYIRGLLEPERQSTALLLFNMLKAGNVPDATPGSYFELG